MQRANQAVEARRVHAWWMLLACVPFLVTTWLAFLYAGSRARKPAWIAFGAVYLLVLLAAISVVPHALAGYVILAGWIAGMVHAASIRPEYVARLQAESGPGRAAPRASTATAEAMPAAHPSAVCEYCGAPKRPGEYECHGCGAPVQPPPAESVADSPLHAAFTTPEEIAARLGVNVRTTRTTVKVKLNGREVPVDELDPATREMLRPWLGGGSPESQ
jgi:hypothetical protein